MSKQVDLGATRPAGVVQIVSGLWVVSAAFIPVYRTLPGLGARVWLYGVMALIAATVLLAIARSPKWWGIWAFAGYASIAAGITSSAASGFAATLLVAFQLLVVLGVAPFAVRGMILADTRVLARASLAFVIGQSVSALAGIVQLFGGDVFGISQGNERSPGLAGHPNVLGVMASVAILLCTHALLAGRRHRFATWAVLGVNLLALVATGSLSSMFACVFGVLILLYSHGYRILRMILVSATTFAAVWAVLSVPAVAQVLRDPVQRFYQVTGQTEAISTLDIRVQTYNAAWASIERDPFLGRGLDMENAASIDIGTVVHNIFLRAWYQGGALLAIAIGIILVAVLLATLQAVRDRRNGLAVGVMVVLLSYGLTSAFFEQAYYWLPVLAAWGSLPRTSLQRGRRLEYIPSDGFGSLRTQL